MQLNGVANVWINNAKFNRIMFYVYEWSFLFCWWIADRLRLKRNFFLFYWNFDFISDWVSFHVGVHLQEDMQLYVHRDGLGLTTECHFIVQRMVSIILPIEETLYIHLKFIRSINESILFFFKLVHRLELVVANSFRLCRFGYAVFEILVNLNAFNSCSLQQKSRLENK